jgi:hypothetical protein
VCPRDGLLEYGAHLDGIYSHRMNSYNAWMRNVIQTARRPPEPRVIYESIWSTFELWPACQTRTKGSVLHGKTACLRLFFGVVKRAGIEILLFAPRRQFSLTHTHVDCKTIRITWLTICCCWIAFKDALVGTKPSHANVQSITSLMRRGICSFFFFFFFLKIRIFMQYLKLVRAWRRGKVTVFL